MGPMDSNTPNEAVDEFLEFCDNLVKNDYSDFGDVMKDVPVVAPHPAQAEMTTGVYDIDFFKLPTPLPPVLKPVRVALDDARGWAVALPRGGAHRPAVQRNFRRTTHPRQQDRHLHRGSRFEV